MTPKEKIYAQIIDVKNEERIILGLTPNDKERDLANGFARNHTIKELEDDLAYAKLSLAVTKHKAKVDAFFATEAGVKYRAELEAKHESLMAAYEDYKTTTLRWVRDFLDKVVGCEWKIRSFCNTGFTLQMCDENDNALFGHDIDYHYSSFEGRFEINYGSFGSFDPTASPYRSAYLKGMATLADPAVAKDMKKILMGYSKQCARIRKEESNIKSQLQNPPIND